MAVSIVFFISFLSYRVILIFCFRHRNCFCYSRLRMMNLRRSCLMSFCYSCSKSCSCSMNSCCNCLTNSCCSCLMSFCCSCRCYSLVNSACCSRLKMNFWSGMCLWWQCRMAFCSWLPCWQYCVRWKKQGGLPMLFRSLMSRRLHCSSSLLPFLMRKPGLLNFLLKMYVLQMKCLMSLLRLQQSSMETMMQLCSDRFLCLCRLCWIHGL